MAGRPFPSGIVAFLFTDIEGSTIRWQQFGRGMGTAVAHHDAILRASIEERDGYIFKTVGDAFCAAFERAEDALAAALAAQRALGAEDWGEVGAIAVRMAVHVGAAEERDADYFGPAVNRAARLLSAGHGGQVLLSLAAQELVRDALPPDVTLRDLGERVLKDLDRPERIFQLEAPGLPEDFPALAAVDHRPNNLPLQVTSFVGREREVAEIAALLVGPEGRLVTLTGPGGVGKTRLAVHVAGNVLDRFPNGVWFVDLSSVSAASRVPFAVASVLGVREGGRPLTDALGHFLRPKRLLLLLDNFEHLLDAAAFVSNLVRAAPDLRVFVTSRTVLQLRGEREVQVPPLPLPDPSRREPLDIVTQYAAVRLFVQRAADADSDFAVVRENAPILAALCARLDGLPLSIELAAAQVRVQSPEAMLSRLDKRLPLLVEGPRDAPARQQTLRATVAWSYDLLSPEEQRLFRLLSVFAGGFTVEAAEAVAARADGSTEPAATSRDIASLSNKSLIRRQEDTDAIPRYAMLETIREFATERLLRDEEAVARSRHAAYFLALAEQAASAPAGPDQDRWLRLLDADLGNLRAALDWALSPVAPGAPGETAAAAIDDNAARRSRRPWEWWSASSRVPNDHLAKDRKMKRDAEGLRPTSFASAFLDQAHELALRDIELHRGGREGTGLRLGMALLEFWTVRGYPREAERWLDWVLSRQDELSAISRAEISFSAANLARIQGNLARARPLFERSKAIWEKLGNRHGIGRALSGLGCLAIDEGNIRRAVELAYEAMIVFRALDHRPGIAATHINLGVAYSELGDLERAWEHFEQSRRLYKELGDRRGIALALNNVGSLAEQRGDLPGAREQYSASLAAWTKVGDRSGIALVLNNLANIAMKEGAYDRAAAHLHEALAIRASINEWRRVAETLAALAGFARLVDDPASGARLLGASASVRSAVGDSSVRAATETNRVAAEVRALLGDERFAREWNGGMELHREQAVDEALALLDRLVDSGVM